VPISGNTDACGLSADLLDANDADLFFVQKNNIVMRIYSLYRRMISMEIALKEASSSCATIFFENQTFISDLFHSRLFN